MEQPGIEILHVGLDGLDVAFKGYLPEAALEQLERGREAAAATNAPALVKVGSLDVHVAETGARGGYRYRADTGDDGEVWFFKRNTAKDLWRLRVSVKSLPLAVYGYAAVRKRLYERLEAMGATVLAESIGRVDFAVDMRLPGFALDPAAFVAHAHATREAHEEDEGAVVVNYTGRRVSSVTIGKMPGRQVIVYDKRREAVAKRKYHWFDIWGIEDWREDRTPVWRLEVRAGKRHLKDYWRITTWQDLDDTFADMVRGTLRAVRYTDPADRDPNVTRRRLHPLWQTAEAEMLRALAGDGLTESGVAPGKMISGRRPVIQETYRGLIAGLAASYAVAFGLNEREAASIHTRIAGDIEAYIKNDPQKFRRSLARAKQRLHFTREAYPYDGRPATAEAGFDDAAAARDRARAAADEAEARRWLGE